MAIFSPSYAVLPQSFIGSSNIIVPEGVVERSRIAAYSVPCGLTWGADEADMEAPALWGVTD